MSAGNVFENDVCRLLAKWAGQDTALTCSVASLWVRRRTTAIAPIDGWEHAGDLQASKACGPFPFVVECKRRSDAKLDSFVEGVWESTVWGFWAQAREQAERVNVQRGVAFEPLLFFQRPRHPRYVMARMETERWLLPPLQNKDAALRVSLPRMGVVIATARELLWRPLTTALRDR